MFGLSLGWFAVFVFVAGAAWTLGAIIVTALWNAITARRQGP